MNRPQKLYKMTIVVWSDRPIDDISLEVEDMASEATGGEVFCPSCECEEVTDSSQFPEVFVGRADE